MNRDDELEREIRTHLELEAEEREAAGMSEVDARYAARRAFGNVTRTKEDVRAVEGWAWLTEFRDDARYAVRTLLKNRGFAAAAILTLALGNGATTAIFSVVMAVLIRPLPFPQADRLVQIIENVPAADSASGSAVRLSSMNDQEFDWWREHVTTLSELAVSLPEAATVTSTGEGAMRLKGARVSAALFRMRGLAPVLGRWLFDADARADARVAVISAHTWTQLFGADPSVIGKALTLNGEPYVVIGVMPPAFGNEAFWLPYVRRPGPAGGVRLVTTVGLLRAGVSAASASAEVNALGRQLRGLDATDAVSRFEVVRLRDQEVGAVRRPLQLLAWAVVAVLLIVCANVANLVLVRGTARHAEFALRRALGAARARLVRQLLTEGVVLGLAGGVAGIAIASGALAVLRGWATLTVPDSFQMALGPLGPTVLPRVDHVGLDYQLLAFALLVSLTTGILLMLAPALRLSRAERRAAFVASAPARETATPKHRRAGQLLVLMQLSASTVLLIVAGLLLRSFVNLSTIPLGFERSTRIFQLVAPGEYPRSRRLELGYAVAARLRSVPGVQFAGFTNTPPLATDSMRGTFLPPLLESRRRELTRYDSSQIRAVSPGYLQALGVRLVAGRWLRESDAPGRPLVVVVNTAWVNRYLAGGLVIGTHVRSGQNDWEIVGVVEDVRLRIEDGPGRQPAAELPMIAFVDARQIADVYAKGQLDRPRRPDLDALLGGSQGLSFALRGPSSTLAMETLRRALQDIDGSLAMDGMTTMGDVFAGLIGRQRFYAAVVGGFAGVAAIIALIGIYGVLAFVASQRTREFGIRLALGASPSTVMGLVAREGLLLVGVGLGLGVVGAMAAAQSLRAILYGVTPLHSQTFIVVAVTFGVVALVASSMPALRASRTDPVIALRD